MPNEKRIPKRPTSGHKANVGARRLMAALILFALIVLLVIGTVFFNGLYQRQSTTPGTSVTTPDDSSFGITSLRVTGNYRYSESEILYASGLKLGQSIWSVSTKQAEQNILSLCPYVDTVEIRSTTFGNYEIVLNETTVLGAFSDKGEWVVVGANGNMLERLPITDDVPPRMIHLKGLTYSGGDAGKPAADERSISILRSLATALQKENIEQISAIDLSDKTDISLCWNNQIVIYFGSDANLAYEVKLIRELLPRILESHGAQVRGKLDLSAYSSDSLPDQAFFTPQDF